MTDRIRIEKVVDSYPGYRKQRIYFNAYKLYVDGKLIEGNSGRVFTRRRDAITAGRALIGVTLPAKQ